MTVELYKIAPYFIRWIDGNAGETKLIIMIIAAHLMTPFV